MNIKSLIIALSFLSYSCTQKHYVQSNEQLNLSPDQLKLSSAQKKTLGECDFSKRMIIHRDKNIIKGLSNKNGILAYYICINRAGDVIAVEYNKNESTITNEKEINNVSLSLFKYKYSEDLNAPEEQCGEFKITIDNYKGIR